MPPGLLNKCLPTVAASAATPVTALQWNGKTKYEKRIRDTHGRSGRGKVQGIALRAGRLFIFSDPRNLKPIGNGQFHEIQQFADVFFPDPKFHSAKQVRPQPIHSNRVLVTENAFDACRIQNRFGKKRVRQISEPSGENEGHALTWRIRAGHCARSIRISENAKS